MTLIAQDSHTLQKHSQTWAPLTSYIVSVMFPHLHICKSNQAFYVYSHPIQLGTQHGLWRIIFRRGWYPTTWTPPHSQPCVHPTSQWGVTCQGYPKCAWYKKALPKSLHNSGWDDLASSSHWQLAVGHSVFAPIPLVMLHTHWWQCHHISIYMSSTACQVFWILDPFPLEYHTVNLSTLWSIPLVWLDPRYCRLC